MNKGRLTIVATFLFIIGCASNLNWLNVPPSNDETFYAGGYATMPRQKESSQSAVLMARQELASQIETHITALTKEAYEQVGIGKDPEINAIFSNAVKATVDQSLAFSVPNIPSISKNVKNNQVRTEVVYKLDVGPVNQAMLDNIKERQMLYQRFRTGELFNELEENIEKERAN